MAIVVKLTGDLSDLEAKLKNAGVKVEAFGDNADDAGKKASGAFSSDLESKIQRIEEATKRSAEATETLASHAGGMNDLAEGFGNVERVALGMNDIMGVAAEKFGLSLGPAQEYAQALGDVAGGLEGVIGGGVALVQQIAPIVTGMVPMIASTWAHVTALYAQAAAMVAANLPMIAVVAALALLAAGVVLLVTHWDDITAKFPILGEAADAIKLKFEEFTGWITDTFVPAVLEIYNGVKDAVEKAIAFVVDHWDEIRAFIQPAIEGLTMIIQAQIDAWVIIFQTVVGVIKGIIDVFMGVFTGDWQRAWDGVKAIIQSVWDGIKGIIETAIGLIEGLAPLIKNAGKALGEALFNGLKSALSATAGFAGDVASAVLDAVTRVVNSQVIDRINRTLEFSFDTHIPGVGSITINPPDLPHLAKGMWEVPGATGVDNFPAILAGGEMVLPARPAEALRQALAAGAGGASGATANGGGAARATPAGGGASATDETLAAVLDELKKANILAAKQNDILKEPQLVDFMSRGDPNSLARILAPFMADQLAQIYRRQWSP